MMPGQAAARVPGLPVIAAEVRRLAAVIDAPEGVLPTFGRSEDYARPHIEADARLHWVVVERGIVIARRTTDDPDELLYWTFAAVVSEMAGPWKLAHRIPGRDTRRLLFARQLDLLGQLSPAWRERLRAELDAVLARYPYVDR